MKRGKFTHEPIQAIGREGEGGRKVADLAGRHHRADLHRWKAQYEGWI